MGSGLSISVFRSVGFSWLGVRGLGACGFRIWGFRARHQRSRRSWICWGLGFRVGGPITTTTATTTAGTATTAPATTAAATTTTAASTVTSTTISASIAASRLMTASTTASTGDHYDYYDHGDYGKDYCCCCCCCNINSASSLTSDVRASWLLACYWPCPVRILRSHSAAFPESCYPKQRTSMPVTPLEHAEASSRHWSRIRK